jgi:hypothetical protein
MYKTGDLGQYNDDGTVSYIGRIQGSFVKIRGQRVEIGEVEHQIRVHLGRGSRFQAMVEPLGKTAESMLVAFVGFNSSTSNDTDLSLASSEERKLRELRESLLSNLPSYMLPSEFITLERLPLTATGKQDRQKLRKYTSRLYTEHMELGATFKPFIPDKAIPTASEIRLREIWSKILQRPTESIGLNDTFFGLGGNSLSAVSLVAEARNMGVSLTVQAIFKNPSLRQMTSAADFSTNPRAVGPLAFSLTGGVDRGSLLEDAVSQCEGITHYSQIEDMFPCTPLQEGMFSLAQINTGTYVAREIISLSSTIDLARFRHAWKMSIRALPILRTRIIQSPRGMMQVISKDLPLTWLEVDDLELYIQADKDNEFQLGQSLARYAISQDSEGNIRFIWTVSGASEL